MGNQKTEQELIDAINALIDEGIEAKEIMSADDIAERVLAGGDWAVTKEAAADLVRQIFTFKFEPWKAPPGTRPRLRA